MIVDSISYQGGLGCVNTTAVFVEGDPTPVAEAIAERLATIPSLPPDDEKAVLPGYSLEAAKTFEEYLLTKAAGTTSHLGGHGVVDELGDGSAVLRPAVHQVDSPHATQVNVELGFPCVWVAPWTCEAGTSVFTDTLVLTAVTQTNSCWTTCWPTRPSRTSTSATTRRTGWNRACHTTPTWASSSCAAKPSSATSG